MEESMVPCTTQNLCGTCATPFRKRPNRLRFSPYPLWSFSYKMLEAPFSSDTIFHVCLRPDNSPSDVSLPPVH